MAIVNTTIWNVLKRKETTGRPRLSTAVNEKNTVRETMKKHPTTTVSDMAANHHRARVKVSQSTVRRGLPEKKYTGHTVPQDAKHSSAKRVRAGVGVGRADWVLQRSTEMNHKSFGTKFDGLIRLRLILTTVMQRSTYGERNDLHMIQTTQAHL